MLLGQTIAIKYLLNQKIQYSTLPSMWHLNLYQLYSVI
jgi:hypothetical protein